MIPSDVLYTFTFSLKYFLILFQNSSSIHALFTSVSFNLQVFEDFPSIFLVYRFFSLVPLWSENTLYLISVFVSLIKICFMAPNMIYFGNGSIAFEENAIGWIYCFLNC